ncbi:ParB N-terminal domain-containing protein [Rubrimonas sp.]|uniref:ParB N-terminal domain-containing protein n=1 Tax=Rubrimonas sp. TaxID=2036015 RepID=UPI002FDE9B62
MARRRRLHPPTPQDLASIRAVASAPLGARAPLEVPGAPSIVPPIALVAADAAAAQQREIATLRDDAARLRAEADRLAAAEAAGLVIRDVPLDEIDVDYLARDRLPRVEDDEAARALRRSIEIHGQRTPIELAVLEADAALPYGLVSGYRRHAALQRLARDTGESRWRTARAIVRTPLTIGAAFVAMVEENEIRESLSYFERGQVCVRAAEQGAFASVDAALDALFQTASPAKRSKIRSFVLIAEAVGDLLWQPQALGERLGLRIAGAIRAGHGGALRRHLGERAAAPRDAAAEQAALADFLAGLRVPRARRAADGADGDGCGTARAVGDASIRLRRRGESLVVEIAGAPSRETFDAAVLNALAALLAGGE